MEKVIAVQESQLQQERMRSENLKRHLLVNEREKLVQQQQRAMQQEENAKLKQHLSLQEQKHQQQLSQKVAT